MAAETVVPSDLVIVLHELGEGLADHGNVSDRPVLVQLEKVPITGFLVVNQRHKHKLVLQLHVGFPDLDLHVGYHVFGHFVDAKKFCH